MGRLYWAAYRRYQERYRSWSRFLIGLIIAELAILIGMWSFATDPNRDSKQVWIAIGVILFLGNLYLLIRHYRSRPVPPNRSFF